VINNNFKFLMFLMVCSLLATLVACSSGIDNSTEHDSTNDYTEIEPVDDVELNELTIGLMPSIDAFPVVMAHYLGYFKDEGLTVHLQPFLGTANRDAALQAGELDAATVDLVAVGLFIEAGLPIRVTGSTNGRFTLVANEGFYSIEDLADEAVVISYNTAIDFVLDQMVQLAGFEPDYIERSIVNPIPERMELLRAGQVSAALLPEPWATIAIADGFYGITNTIEIEFNPFVIAFTDEALETRQAEIKAFYRAYNRAVDFLNATPITEYFHVMVDVIGFSPDVVNHLVVPEFTHNQLPSSDVLDATIEWLLSRELVSEEMTIDDLVSTVAFD